jgi:2-hydroxychromene-2-carboxylate isomerase
MNIDFSQSGIKFYFSFQCPYSYIAWELLKPLLKNKSTSVTPLEIGISHTGSTKFHFRDVWGEPRWKRLISDAKQHEIKLKPPKKYVTSILASRAITAYGKASCEDYISSVFRAVFVAGIDISIPSLLKIHLQSEGLDLSVFNEAIEDSRTEIEANDMQLLWGTRRLRQVPTLEYDQERYSGFIDKYGLERFLRTIND